ncbi:histidine ammonia-lyase [Filibacter limicola]|uniref:Histidine ammonia-lyase n=1 Tax=Sporosarcina limicola TaxID=34101 RepID=A0A927MKN8_9BACL|nr:histidine ammonia-lyase [Sporosarcina limicola]
MAPKTRVKYDKLREVVRPIDEDRIFTPDIEGIARYLLG